MMMTKTPMMVAVMLHPMRSSVGSTAQAMAGTNANAPMRLPTLAQPMAMARRRWNQWFSMVIMGSQLPKP